MTPFEFRYIEDSGVFSTSISVTELANKNDRTLLYGYTCERRTWHVYLKDGEIYLHTYATVSIDRSGKTPDHEMTFFLKHAIVWQYAEDLIPDKRLYPERCDGEFCLLLKRKGIDLPFTTYDIERQNQKFGRYYGKLPEDLLTPVKAAQAVEG